MAIRVKQTFSLFCDNCGNAEHFTYQTRVIIDVPVIRLVRGASEDDDVQLVTGSIPVKIEELDVPRWGHAKAKNCGEQAGAAGHAMIICNKCKCQQMLTEIEAKIDGYVNTKIGGE